MTAAPEADRAMVARRQKAMALCAEATRRELEEALARAGAVEPATPLRQPEVGLVMARGRMGGDGRPFNLGEATVARAAVRIASGETGFAYQLGRDLKKAEASALVDALVQSARGTAMEAALEPIAQRLATERAQRDRQTAATRVNFFTMVRGEDE